jgi:molybdopterin guanine dinucleotide-containing S/N-oxide reductase-like protein
MKTPNKKVKSVAQKKSNYRQENLQSSEESEKTIIKGIGWLGFHGFNAVAVDTKNGKILRIRPLHYDSKYQPEEFGPWKIEARGKVFEPKMKTLVPPLSIAYKKRVYSPNRIKYPLKRVDWDPEGDRHPENRGKSKFQRISWDEATDLIAREIRRVQKKYGPYAILAQADCHGECKTVHAPHGCQTLLLDKMGGYTQQARNPDSWEGWYWGAKHMWGMEYVGLMLPQGNMHVDISRNTELLLFWGCDPETTPWYRSGQASSRFSYWWSELGIKQIYVCPDLNYGAAIHADKWISVLPNTDAALHLGIAYTWISEGTYDKDYVATHTVGFDKFAAYVLGREDGVAKTPAWAALKCGVPEWTIKALAREWAAKRTSIAHFCGGSYIRGPYATEPARLEVANLAMQGLGKPGRHQFTTLPPMYSKLGAIESVTPDVTAASPVSMKLRTQGEIRKQHLPKPFISKAILDPPISYWGSGLQQISVDDQFVKYSYPAPEDGRVDIHMMWTDAPCLTTCWNDGNKTIEAVRDPKIECIVAQHPWLENDCILADIILPVNTKLEEEDIGVDIGSLQYCLIFPEPRCIEPIGESKSDYEVVLEVAKKLGLDEKLTQGKTVEQWIQSGYEKSGVADLVSWEKLNENGYYVIPTRQGWDKDPAGMIKFFEDPESNPLSTPSGKIEFYSERLARHFPDDAERPPLPHWIEKGETHDERLSGERARKYPLLLVSNHGRWRIHAQGDDIAWTREAPTCKVKGWDGYLYEPVWIHASDAAKRNIKNGDIVKVYNERGAVLGGAYLTERIIPRAISMDHGAKCDPIIPGELDRGGAINLISPEGTTSKNCAGQATSGYLVEVEKVSISQMKKWKQQYPEVFNRDYDQASGLSFKAWIVDPGDK